METVAVPQKTVQASTAALQAIKLAGKYATEIDTTRDRLSELAAKRADAIRSALEAGLTQADVGRLLGISPQAVNNALRCH